MSNDALKDRWMPRSTVIRRQQKVRDEVVHQRDDKEPARERHEDLTPDRMPGAIRLS